MLCLAKVAVAWLVLMLLGTNLIGMIVRGLVAPPRLRDLDADLPAWLAGEVKRFERADAILTLGSACVGVLYLVALVHFWNVWVAVAAVMFMVSRIPDLLWEIRTGRKVQKDNMPSGGLQRLTPVLDWGALPVLLFALCHV